MGLCHGGGEGRSYLKLPASSSGSGSIGLHPCITSGRASPTMPSKCHRENPLFHEVTVITLTQSVHVRCGYGMRNMRLIGFTTCAG
jgi:hypothetical protein